MSIKARGKSAETKFASGSRTVGRDVKKGVEEVGRKVKSGAKTVGRDVEKAGKRVGNATRHGMTRADDRLRPNRKR
jgi:predicted small secreted protein